MYVSGEYGSATNNFKIENLVKRLSAHRLMVRPFMIGRTA